MFRYELINSTRKFTIFAEIVSLLKKIYKRDAPFRAVFKVKTLAVLFSPYPREMKHIPGNLNLPPFWRLLVSKEMVQYIPTCALSRARGLSMRTHLTAVKVKTAFIYRKILSEGTAIIAVSYFKCPSNSHLHRFLLRDYPLATLGDWLTKTAFLHFIVHGRSEFRPKSISTREIKIVAW